MCTSMLNIWRCLRAHALGSLNSATGLSSVPTHLNEGVQMLPGVNVDVIVKMAPATGIYLSFARMPSW